MTQDVAEDLLGLEGYEGLCSKNKGKLLATHHHHNHHHHRCRRRRRRHDHHLLLRICTPVACPPQSQHFRGQKWYAAARGDPDASPTPDEVRSAAKAAFEPTPNTSVPPRIQRGVYPYTEGVYPL